MYEQNEELEAEEVGPEESAGMLFDNLDKGNIVDQIENNQAAYVDIKELYDVAVESMTEWKKKYDNAIKLAKLEPDTETKSFPFEGASTVMMPFILEAMLDFNSRAAPELVWADNIVSTKVYGRDMKAEQVSNDAGIQVDQKELDQAVKEGKQDRADRVSEYMNYQLYEKIPDWRDGQDKGLMSLPCVGTFYKKTYRDYDLEIIRSDLLMGDEVIFDMNCRSFEACLNKFQNIKVSRNDLIAFIRGEQKWDIQESDIEDDKKEFDFIEAYSYLDLDNDGIAEPYYLVLDEVTQKIVCCYPNYDEDGITLSEKDEVIKIKEVDCYTQYRFLPDPECGPMGLGWGILLGPMFNAINTNLRQLIDAGTLHLTASNSGLISMGMSSAGGDKGNRAASGPISVALGQLTPIQFSGMGTLRDNIVQMPFSGPSPVLFQLMQYLIESSRSMTNAAVNIEASPGEAASLYLARLDQGLKLPNSIIMRVFDAAKREIKKIHALNYKYANSDEYNRVLDRERQYVMADDFNPEDCDVRLASNPSQGSDLQRITRAEANLQLAMGQHAAGINEINIRQATKDLLEATKTQNIEELMPEKDPNAVDPQMQLMMAEKAADAEAKKIDQELRQRAQDLQAKKLAAESAKEMSRLGLMSDEQEARITKSYVESLKIMAEMGISDPIRAIQEVERTFINDAEGGNENAGQIPTINPDSSGSMAGQPGNQDV